LEKWIGVEVIVHEPLIGFNPLALNHFLAEHQATVVWPLGLVHYKYHGNGLVLVNVVLLVNGS
jgi:hypothetical protein